MGHVHQKVHLRGEKAATVRMLVDTDATFSVIPPRLARALGIKQPRRSVSVTVAGSNYDPYWNRQRAYSGRRSMEALGLFVDPAKKRLSPSRPLRRRLGWLPLTCAIQVRVETIGSFSPP